MINCLQNNNALLTAFSDAFIIQTREISYLTFNLNLTNINKNNSNTTKEKNWIKYQAVKAKRPLNFIANRSNDLVFSALEAILVLMY